MAGTRTKQCNPQRWNSRKNPYRNMIDYIITRKSHLCFIKDSRSYAGLYISSDHRLVKAVININKPAHPRKSNTKIYDNFEISNLRNNAKQCSNLVASEIEIDSADTLQRAWNKAVTACHTAAVYVAPKAGKSNKNSTNPEIMALAEKQKQINEKINSNVNPKTRKTVRTERNKVKADLRKLKAKEQNQQLIQQVGEIEKCKDDSQILQSNKSSATDETKTDTSH